MAVLDDQNYTSERIDVEVVAGKNPTVAIPLQVYQSLKYRVFGRTTETVELYCLKGPLAGKNPSGQATTGPYLSGGMRDSIEQEFVRLQPGRWRVVIGPRGKPLAEKEVELPQTEIPDIYLNGFGALEIQLKSDDGGALPFGQLLAIRRGGANEKLIGCCKLGAPKPDRVADWENGIREVSADANGRALLEAQPGSYAIVGFVDDRAKARAEKCELKKSACGKLELVVTSVSMKVTLTEEGRPKAGTELHACFPSDDVLVKSIHAVTDASGTATLVGLLPGFYRVATADEVAWIRSAPTVKEASRRQSVLRVVRVDNKPAPLVIESRDPGKPWVRVAIDSDQIQIDQAELMALDRLQGPLDNWNAYADTQGEQTLFDFGPTPPGRYGLTLYTAENKYTWFEVTVPRLPLVELNFKPQKRVVTVAVDLPSGFTASRIDVELAPGFPNCPNQPIAATQVANGQVVFNDVMDGCYLISALAKTSAGFEVRHWQALSVTADVTVKLAIPAKTGSIDVRPESGKVRAIAKLDFPDNLMLVTLIDGAGKVVQIGPGSVMLVGAGAVFGGISPGTYKVRLSGPFIEAIETKVQVKAGATVAVKPELKPARRCSLRIAGLPYHVLLHRLEAVTFEAEKNKPLPSGGPIAETYAGVAEYLVGKADHDSSQVWLRFIPPGAKTVRLKIRDHADVVVTLPSPEAADEPIDVTTNAILGG